MNFWFFCSLILINSVCQGEEMAITRIENGLTQAIGIEGETLPRQNILDKMKELKVTAASIAIINNGKIEWAKAYGLISSSNTQRANCETRFQAGSVSKPVAAFAILTLVNQKKLNLDEDVNKYLKSWQIPDNEFTAVHKVTLRHLLSHTSGLSVIGFDGYTRNEKLPTITQTLDGVKPANNPPIRVEFAPGTKMSYSGGAYNVAQQLVEDITKIPFSQFMQNVLLNPLKMDNSTFGYPQGANFAFAHPANGLPMEGGWKNYPECAAAGLWTTPTDLAKWLIEIQNGLEKDSKFLNRELLLDMVTPQVAVHGLGPVINGAGKQLELSFKGRTDGFTCGFVSFPYLKKGAVVMINAGNEFAFIDSVFRSIGQEYQWPSYQVKMKKAVPLSEEMLNKYVGRYSWDIKPNDIYDIFVFREKDQLFWKIGVSSNPCKLYAESENNFFSIDTGYDIVFAEKDNAITTLTIVVQKGFEREFKKL